jgi:hypothetical protein
MKTKKYLNPQEKVVELGRLIKTSQAVLTDVLDALMDYEVFLSEEWSRLNEEWDKLHQ